MFEYYTRIVLVHKSTLLERRQSIEEAKQVNLIPIDGGTNEREKEKDGEAAFRSIVHLFVRCFVSHSPHIRFLYVYFGVVVPDLTT